MTLPAPLATLALLSPLWLAGVLLTAAIVSLAWPVLAGRLGAGSPRARGGVAFGLALAPIALPSLVAGLVLVPGLLGLVFPAVDHCPAHPDHVHLCLTHAAGTDAGRLAPIAALLGSLATIAAGLAAGRRGRARKALRALESLGSSRRAGAARILETPRALAFTHRLLRPQTTLSRGLVEQLDRRQLAVVLAHEAEHVRRRDPLRQTLARLASLPLRPATRRSLLATIGEAAEQACDDAAVGRTGDRLLVAQTILAVESLMRSGPGPRPRLETGVGMLEGPIATRIERLLAPASSPPRPERRARPGRERLAAVAASLLIALGLAMAVGALHHEAEHLLAILLRLI